MFKQFQIKKKSRAKSPSKMIKSPAFMKPQDNIPKINNKIVPIRHEYGLPNQEQILEPLKPFQAWALISTEYLLPRRSARSQTQTKYASFSPCEHLLAKYMRRRPNLIFMKREYSLQDKREERNYHTQQKWQNLLVSERKTTIDIKNTPIKIKDKNEKSKWSNKTNTTATTHGQQDLHQFNNKLVIHITETDIGTINNEYTYRLNAILQRRKKMSQCDQYERKFIHY